jgi:hypothetical protein
MHRQKYQNYPDLHNMLDGFKFAEERLVNAIESRLLLSVLLPCEATT